MKWHVTLAVMLGLLLVCLAQNADAVTIHDVVIGTTPPPGQPATDTDGPGCAQLQIGTTGGTDYGTFKIVSVDGINPAYIQAIENGASCYGQAPDSVRDRLLLVNADIIVNQSGADQALRLDYYPDFASSPDGNVVFSGSMKGYFQKSGVNVSCGLITPPVTCKVLYDLAIYSPVNTLWNLLPQAN